MKLFPDDVFNLADIALEVARTDPERLAVVEPDGRDANGSRRYRRHTYRELSHDAESVAVGLRERGIAERTRTVFMAPPSYGACVLALALTRVGATTVWIDPTVGYRNVAERLRRVEPEAFVGIPLAHLGRPSSAGGRASVASWSSSASRASRARPASTRCAAPPRRRPWRLRSAPTIRSPSSTPPGSTGPAKPALYLHRNLCEVYRIVHRSWALRPRTAASPSTCPSFPPSSRWARAWAAPSSCRRSTSCDRGRPTRTPRRCSRSSATAAWARCSGRRRCSRTWPTPRSDEGWARPRSSGSSEAAPRSSRPSRARCWR